MQRSATRCARPVALGLFLSLILCAGPARAEGVGTILKPKTGKVWHVCKEGGRNKNPGTAEAPLKNIDKAIKKAKAGDTIAVCGGVYSGTFNIGYLESDKPLRLYGGFAKDFSARDVVKHATRFQPDNASGARSRKPLIRFSKEVDGTVVDGFVFDMGLRNGYSPSEGKPKDVATGMLLLPPKKAPGQKATVTESCLSIPSAAKAGEVTLRNNVFANCAKFGVQAAVRGGTLRVLNNVFVANRMAAVEAYGTCRSRGGPKSKTRCGEAEIAHNTILFSWSRTKELMDMGYGVRVMTKLGYNIHHNLIGTSVLAGIDHSRFNKDDWIKVDNNAFFVNKTADMEYSPASNTKLNLRAAQFEDLELGSVSGNTTKIPKDYPVDKAYLQGFLAARYSEKADFKPDSPANVLRAALGMNKQGKLSSQVSMYANRYPWKAALALFGALSGHGAATPK